MIFHEPIGDFLCQSSLAYEFPYLRKRWISSVFQEVIRTYLWGSVHQDECHLCISDDTRAEIFVHWKRNQHHRTHLPAQPLVIPECQNPAFRHKHLFVFPTDA